jgi:hypothetical protein
MPIVRPIYSPPLRESFTIALFSGVSAFSESDPTKGHQIFSWFSRSPSMMSMRKLLRNFLIIQLISQASANSFQTPDKTLKAGAMNQGSQKSSQMFIVHDPCSPLGSSQSLSYSRSSNPFNPPKSGQNLTR